MNDFKEFWLILPLSNRRSAVVLVLLMLVGMVLETLGVGLIVPLITILTQEDLHLQSPALSSIINAIGNPDHETLMIYAMLVMLGTYAAKNLFLAILVWKQVHFAFAIRRFLAKKLFTNYLHQPYTFHLQHNSAQLIRNVTAEVSIFVSYGINSIMTLLIEGFVLIAIVSLLIAFEPYGTLLVILVFGSAVFGFQRIIRYRIDRWGKERQYHDGMSIQHLQQGLGGVKDVKMLGCEETFLNKHYEHYSKSAKIAGWQQVLQALPRLWLELIAVGGIVILVLSMVSQGRSMQNILPVLALFAAAGFRLLPSLSRILSALQSLRYSIPVANVLMKEINLEVKKDQLTKSANICKFRDKIYLHDIVYSYPSTSKPALNKVSVNIGCRESVGFIGSSGAGKSTIIDAILGLLKLDSGQVLVDGVDIQKNIRGWQNIIGYVPQSVFLTDDTLRSNVAFGLKNDEVDNNAVWNAIQAAQLEELVSSLPDGLETIVGERGVRLSGGQRQRIGIARALYHDPAVLVLDEATSSLDVDTERDIMETINVLHGSKTLIIVAHRLSTVERCDRIYRLEHGHIIEEGTPTLMLNGYK
jgi:ABC-type multidrug transport system fused ATPase/permease subunit